MNVLTRDDIALLVAQDIPDGSCVNLGIGIPTLISDWIPADREVMLHSEQGLLGLGPRAAPGEEDDDVVNAGKQHITLVPGASVFNHADSFLLVRGGHVDIACLGAFQVSSNGDLANWTTGLDKTPGVGGAMDLASGARKVWVQMEHNHKDGAPRILRECTFPLTAPACVKRIYTDLAVIEVHAGELVVSRMVEGMSFDHLQRRTDAPLTLAKDYQVLKSGQAIRP